MKRREENQERTGSDPVDEVPAAEDTMSAGDSEVERAEAEESPADEVRAGDGDADPVKALEDEVAELKDQILRMAADNQNTRKRLVKQQQDAHTYRHQDILRDLVEVVDNFERAIESASDSRDFDTFHQGILMIERQFSAMLSDRYHLERVGREGEVFDPRIHEAVMMNETSDVVEETVTQVLQSGYRLHDRLIRPAKVAVSRPPSNTETVKEETAQ